MSDNRNPAAPWEDESAQPFIQIKGLTKRFGEVAAVDNITLDIYENELFAILGGSGCGKTTLLRMLAGFERPSLGRIIIDGTDMTNTPPYERPVNMMFQSYAVFPHMSVEKNIAYGLRKEGVATDEIGERVANTLSLVQLSGYERRKPHQLSGGQLQRVALARALIKQPKVLLLDEPLAALDKRLREQTQFELMNIQEELGITFIVVTHDQEEAMTLATRIAVMDQGSFVQTATPTQLYEYPANRFVAGFFGTINLFAGEVTAASDNEMAIEAAALGRIRTLPDPNFKPGDRAWVAVRPEKIAISKEPLDADESTVVKGNVSDLGYFGNHSIYRVKVAEDLFIQVSAQNRHRAADREVTWEDEVYLAWHRNSSIVLAD